MTIFDVLATSLLNTYNIPGVVLGTVRGTKACETFPEHKFVDLKLLDFIGLALNLISVEVDHES